MNETGLNIVSGLLIIGGVFGSILPILPGLPVSYAGLLLFLIGKPGELSSGNVWAIVIFGILLGLTLILDIFAPAMAAKGHKASKAGTTGAILGGLIGIFILGPLGIILGPFVGAFVGEFAKTKNTKQAFDIALAATFGLILSSLFKVVVGISMFIYFLIVLL